MACGLIMDGKLSETMHNHLKKCQRIDREKFENLAAHDDSVVDIFTYGFTSQKTLRADLLELVNTFFLKQLSTKTSFSIVDNPFFH
jgi:hypothetical protein